MTKIKRLLVLSLAFVLMVSIFAACGSAAQTPAPAASSTETAASPASQTSAQESATAPAGPKELVVYAAMVTQDIAPKLVADFEQQTGVKVKMTCIASDKFVQTFMVAANGGSPIDLLWLNGQDARAFAKKGLIMDLTSDTSSLVSRFNDAAVKQYTFQNKLYGIPSDSGNTSMCYYNKDIFDKYNLKVPETYADMVADNNILKQNKLTLFGFGGATTYMWPMWFFNTFAQTSGNKSIERTIDILSGKAKFTDPDVVEALQVLANFGKEGMFQPGFNGADSNGGKSIFTSGKSAMFYGGIWELDGFRKAGFDDKKMHLGIIPFPIVKDGAKSEQTGSAAGGCLSIYSKINPQNKVTALKFIDIMTSDQEMTKRFSLNNPPSSNFYPANKNVKAPDGIPGDALNQVIVEKLMPTTVTFLDWIWPPEITKEFQSGIQAVVGQQISAENEAKKLQKVMDDLLAKGYDFNATN